jgi:hypothetical protein
MDNKQDESSFYSCASRGSNAVLCKERGREVTARRSSRASVRSRGAEHSDNGCCEGHAKREILSVRRRQMVSWIGGMYLGVHAAQRGAPVHIAY